METEMDRSPVAEDDEDLKALVKSLDDAHDELARNGPVSPEDVRRRIDALYARKRAEASTRSKAAND